MIWQGLTSFVPLVRLQREMREVSTLGGDQKWFFRLVSVFLDH